MTKRSPKKYSSQYQDYLRSPTWQAKRSKTFAMTNHKCVNCGKNATQCHHLSYVNLGKEKPGRDIVPLCERCHNRVHFKKYWDNPKGREAMAKDLQDKFKKFL